MIKLKVLKSTDGKHIGQIFEISDLNLKNTEIYSGGIFHFDYLEYITPTIVRLWNSNYTAIVEIVKN
jgi:hypothetical protein